MKSLFVLLGIITSIINIHDNFDDCLSKKEVHLIEKKIKELYPYTQKYKLIKTKSIVVESCKGLYKVELINDKSSLYKLSIPVLKCDTLLFIPNIDKVNLEFDFDKFCEYSNDSSLFNISQLNTIKKNYIKGAENIPRVIIERQR